MYFAKLYFMNKNTDFIEYYTYIYLISDQSETIHINTSMLAPRGRLQWIV